MRDNVLTREQLELARDAMHRSVDQAFDLIEYDENGQAKNEYRFSWGYVRSEADPATVTAFEAVSRVEFVAPCDFHEAAELLKQHDRSRSPHASMVGEEWKVDERERMLAMVRNVLRRLESGEIEADGVALVVPFNRAHATPVMAANNSGDVAMTDRTVGLVADVAIAGSVCGLSEERRRAIREMFEHGIRSVERQLDGCLLPER